MGLENATKNKPIKEILFWYPLIGEIQSKDLGNEQISMSRCGYIFLFLSNSKNSKSYSFLKIPDFGDFGDLGPDLGATTPSPSVVAQKAINLGGLATI